MKERKGTSKRNTKLTSWIKIKDQEQVNKRKLKWSNECGLWLKYRSMNKNKKCKMVNYYTTHDFPMKHFLGHSSSFVY